MIKEKIEWVVFNIKYILIFFYAKLAITILELLYQSYTHHHLSPVDTMFALEDLDTTMIANLIIMAIKGSYHSFVSKTHKYKNENISSGTLKIKIGTSIINVTSVYLLQLLFDPKKYDIQQIGVKIGIEIIILLGVLTLGKVNQLLIKSELMELEIEEKEILINKHKKLNDGKLLSEEG